MRWNPQEDRHCCAIDQHIVGPEGEALRPRGVTNHVARLTIKERSIQSSDDGFLAHVQAMREGIGPAIGQVMTGAPDHVIMGVIIEAFIGGVAAADALQKDLSARRRVDGFDGGSGRVAKIRREAHRSAYAASAER